MSRKAVVFGSGGQLGVELLRELRERGYEVTGFERTHLDITDPAKVEQTLASIDPQYVYNAAAYNQVDVAETEPAAAFAVNGLAVRNLALACRQVDARLIHFSTDYVFDGTLGRSYVEMDQTHPLGAYAVSKLAGELYAQAYLDNPLIVRTSGVFGPAGMHTNRGNFLELMLRLAREHKPIRVVDDYFASPAYAPLLAARSIDLAEASHSGVFHVGGGTPISWFAYAKLIFAAAGLSPEITPTNAREYRTVARRPQYSALENKRMAEVGIAPMPPMAEAIQMYMKKRAEMQ
jgi:dTDP-4-dehydrorhamnose reductase